VKVGVVIKRLEAPVQASDSAGQGYGGGKVQ